MEGWPQEGIEMYNVNVRVGLFRPIAAIDYPLDPAHFSGEILHREHMTKACSPRSP